MALTISVLKQTETLAIVKVYGTNDSATINLDTDLLSSTMILDPVVARKVPISYVSWYVSGAVGDQVAIVRSAIPILNLYQNGELDFAGNGGFNETTREGENIVVTITGTGGVYLTLRKAAGYISKVQPWTYGQYDDPTSAIA